MKVSIFIRIFAVLLVALFTLSGCSYMKFEESVKDMIEEAQPSVDPFEGWSVVTEEELMEEIISTSQTETSEKTESESGKKKEETAKEEELPENVICTTYGDIAVPMKLMQIGESCTTVTGWRDYQGNVFHNGTPGVTFTLNSVEVYDNFFDANLDTYGIAPLGLSQRGEDALRTNAFVLLEITAKYEVPESAKQRVMVTNMDIEPCYIEQKVMDYYRAGGMESRMLGGIPQIEYFSHRPKPDDPELDYIHAGMSFMLNNGEELTYQLGIVAGHEYVDNNNLFLRMGWINPKVPGATWNVYEILPDESNEKYREKPTIRSKTVVQNYDDYEIKEDNWYGGIEYISASVGETLPAFVECKYDDTGETFYIRNNGLYLTLDNVEVYNSFEESGLSKENLYYYVTDGTLKGEKFVVADFTAEYIAPEGGPEEIKAYANLKGIRLLNRTNVTMDDDTQFPETVWYSGEQGDKGDFTAYTIKDGEKYHYTLGVIADPGYVDEKNVFLQVCCDDYGTKDYVYHYFELLTLD